MKIFSRAATASKLQIRLKLSLGWLEIKFPLKEQDLILIMVTYTKPSIFPPKGIWFPASLGLVLT